jgi:hypothetical protein
MAWLKGQSGIPESGADPAHRHYSIGEALPSLRDAAHGVPIGIIPNYPLHHQRFALQVDQDLGSRREVKPLAKRFGMTICPLD